MSLQFYYIDPQGKRWNLESIKASEIPGFVRSVRVEDATLVTIHRSAVQCEEPAKNDHPNNS